MANTEPRVTYNVQLLAEDMAEKGWTKLDLANKAKVADMTVIRFLRGDQQTAPTVKKLAAALGRSVRRYIVPAAVPEQLHASDGKRPRRRALPASRREASGEQSAQPC